MKQDGNVTEQELTVHVIVLAGTATEGDDFHLNQDGETLTYSFPPAAQRLAIPLTIIDDALPEKAEEFRLSLLVPAGAPAFLVSGNAITTVTIMDNDGRLIINLALTWEILWSAWVLAFV